MLITYNSTNNRFELQLQSGASWNAEMELAKVCQVLNVMARQVGPGQRYEPQLSIN